MGDIWSTIVREFSDLGDVATVVKVILRLLVAGLLGGALGFERESAGKAAGLRTHMLVAMGAALFVMVPQLLHPDSPAEVSRVVQGLVAGIGFLGAGAILHKGDQAQGLTTAANIWLTAGVGVAAGLGREALAVLATALALFVLALLPRLAGPFLPEPPPEKEPPATMQEAPKKEDGQ